MKEIILSLLLVCLVLAPGCAQEITIDAKEITNFEECAAAGNPVMESYPRQCAADGETFVEIVEQECAGEGELADSLTMEPKQCCEGLHEIGSGYRNGEIYCTSEACGDGNCRSVENELNCEEDC